MIVVSSFQIKNSGF